jgi:hypothetical protein
VKVTAPGFQTVEQKGVVLAFDQVTTLNFTLRPAGTFTMIQVTEAAPLLNRDFFGLVFLNAGVSEAAGSGTTDNYPAGTDTTVEQLLANSHFHMLPVGLCAKSVPSWVKTLSCPPGSHSPHRWRIWNVSRTVEQACAVIARGTGLTNNLEERGNCQLPAQVTQYIRNGG